ncbi:TspO/MBR family protein [Halorussus litoreus]|uniref:TspO/MBR family protein n=1 Tax=Halorussus litoreus TaxID=1710536 RepID=UPI000E27A414|nr:TspO/MBR family protein [Halorussus litoreus]
MSVLDAFRSSDGGPSITWPALLGSIIVCELAGIVPSILTASDVATWYPTLAKPGFTPPSWLFGPVWTTLYLLMGVALYLVWQSGPGRPRRIALALFGVQLALNAGWTLVFFGAHSLFGGLVVILALLAAIVATMAASRRVDRRAVPLLVPYLLWVGFATLLTYEIWRLNA